MFGGVVNILRKITRENLILNKKRTIYTCIGIILSTALLSGFFILFSSVYEYVLNGVEDGGYYHFSIHESSKIYGGKIDEHKIEKLEKNKQVKAVNKLYDIEQLRGKFGKYHMMSADEQSLKNMNIKLLEGRYPKSDTEIIVPKYILFESDNLKVGDRFKVDTYLSLSTYDKKAKELSKQVDKKYTVVGVTDEDYLYYNVLFTTGIKTKDPYICVSIKDTSNYEEVIPQILGLKNMKEVSACDISVNTRLLNVENCKFSNKTNFMIVLILLIIIVSSILYIKNSFSILVSEKSRLYGMLLSVGATRKQIKKVVLREGFMIGLFSIPLGLLSGIVGSLIFVKISDRVYLPANYTLLHRPVTINPYDLLLAAIISAIIIYVSIVMIFHKSFKASPVDNIRRSKYIKRGDKKEVPRYIKAIFKTGGVIAYNDIKHSRKKYRTTAISIILSVTLLIVSSTLINYMYPKQIGLDIDSNTNLDVSIERDANILNDKTIQRISELDSVKKLQVFYLFYNLSVKGVPDYYEFELCEDEVFRECVSALHLDYEEVKDKVIIFDRGETETVGTNLKTGDALEGTFTESGKKINLEIAAISPKTLGNFDKVILGNQQYFKDLGKERVLLNISYTSNNEFIQELKDNRIYIKKMNYENVLLDSFWRHKLLARFFLYGFVIIISFIGIVNLFNTVAANINYRSREIAMYKSVGVSTKEFKHMIMYETLSYTIKALAIGIVLGVGASYIMYRYFMMERFLFFIFPLNAIIISIVVVLAMVYLVMRYTVSKIDKKNIIETIRQENI